MITENYKNCLSGSDEKHLRNRVGAIAREKVTYNYKQFCLHLFMEFSIEKYKGVHPGLILERELRKRNFKKRAFAMSINEYPQVLNDITKCKRGVSASLSLKLDKALGLPEGTMFIFQAHYEIKKEQEKHSKKVHPDFSIIREILFWDTDFHKIDWDTKYHAVIRRVFERGNAEEKREILHFYGKEKVIEVVGDDGIDSQAILSYLR